MQALALRNRASLMAQLANDVVLPALLPMR
jgi:hypothetical protein